jgi:hypothetical protein
MSLEFVEVVRRRRIYTPAVGAQTNFRSKDIVLDSLVRMGEADPYAKYL